MDKAEKRYPATGIQAYWGTDVDPMKKRTGLIFSHGCISGLVLDKEEIENRIRGIMRRHPALRTVFFRDDESVYQSVQEKAAFEVRTLDLQKARESDDMARISETQRMLIRKSYGEILEELACSTKKLPLLVSAYVLNEKSACYIFFMDHSVSDGSSVRIIRNELLSESVDEAEDGYREYLEFLGREYSSGEARCFWDRQAAEYSGFDFFGTGEFTVDTTSEKIVLNTEIIRTLQPYCEKENISVVSLILYAYAQAVLRIFDMDNALFSLVSSGRQIPVKGIERTVGCLVQEIPVLLFRGDEPRDFKRRYREAEEHCFVPDEVMWRIDRRKVFKLPLSEVFREGTLKEYCQEFDLNDYEHMPINSFIIKREDGLNVYLHRDAAQISTADFHRLADEMRRILFSYLRADEPMTLQGLVSDRIGRYKGIAVECGNKALTYDALEAKIRKITGTLSLHGLGPGDRIIVKMRRSVDLIAAMYGVFCSGAAAVPVNDDIPSERLKMIAATSGAAFVLTDAALDELLREQASMDPAEIRQAGPDDSAVIIYTSGSTAEPKGVCHTQREEAVTFLQFPMAVNLAGLETGVHASVISRTELSYNLVYHMECPSPLFGKKLILLDADERNDVLRTVHRIAENPQSAMAFTPSLLEAFLENKAFSDAFGTLSLAVLAGEPVGESLRERLCAFPGQPRLLSLYGSTECQSIGWTDLRSETVDAIPLPDTEVRIVCDGRIAAVGEAGEICVSSDVASKSCVTGEALPQLCLNGRLYFRTGDEGVSADGRHFQIRGRLDRCIKLHGQRIDPAEIERHIERIDGVDACAVVLKRTETRSDALTAYCRGKADMSAKTLREQLSDKLPRHMIPSICLHLEEFPLTANGKINYRMLAEMPIPEAAPAQSGAMSEKETRVAEIAAVILGMDSAALTSDADLLALGLDSIKALSLVSELQRDGWILSLNRYYLDPTIRGIAGALKEGKAFERIPAGSCIATPVQSHWAAHAEANDRINGLYIFRIFIAGRSYTEAAFKDRMERIAGNHPALRSAFVRGEDGSFVQMVTRKDGVECQYLDLRTLRDQDDADALGRRQESFLKTYAYQLGTRYLGANAKANIALHVSELRLDENASAFVILLNHCHADGLSERILLQELLAQELPIREDGYCEYMAYVNTVENRRRAADFWNGYLANASPACIPVCREWGRAAAPVSRTAALDASEARRFRERCREAGFSVPMMVNYLYGKALLEVLGEERIIFEVLFHGRDLPVRDPENTVGCLTERIPVVIGKEDDARSFVRSMSEAGSFGYIPVEDMFLAAWKKRISPPIARAVVAEIDVIPSNGCFCREYNAIDRERLQHEHYLLDDACGIRVIFHYDAALHEDSFYEKLCECLMKLLHGNSALSGQG